jgi:hypothetical protein
MGKRMSSLPIPRGKRDYVVVLQANTYILIIGVTSHWVGMNGMITLGVVGALSGICGAWLGAATTRKST